MKEIKVVETSIGIIIQHSERCKGACNLLKTITFENEDEGIMAIFGGSKILFKEIDEKKLPRYKHFEDEKGFSVIFEGDSDVVHSIEEKRA